VLTRELMRRPWGSFSPDKSYQKVYVGRLRSKITRSRGETACDVETVRGVGYRLLVRSAPDAALASGRAA
jgi:DNA-binding response OmpR family regulator